MPQTEGQIDLAIEKLQEKEAQLHSASSTAMYARQRPGQHQQQHFQLRPTTSSSERKPQCNLCKSTSHWQKDCPELLVAQKAAQESRQKKKAVKQSSQDDRVQRLEDMITKLFKELQDSKSRKYNHKAFKAEETSSSSNKSSQEDTSNPGSQECEEVAHISKEAASKTPKDHWFADSGTSSYMTDQLHNFRGPLLKIRPRYIKCGGGVLKSSEMGTAILRDKTGNQIKLLKTLFVPQLGASLLSGRRMCQSGLTGSFDEKNLYFRDKEGRTLIQASELGGVYIVDSVSPQIHNFSFKATDLPSQIHAFEA